MKTAMEQTILDFRLSPEVSDWDLNHLIHLKLQPVMVYIGHLQKLLTPPWHIHATSAIGAIEPSGISFRKLQVMGFVV